MSKDRDLDQFYTKPEVAQSFLDRIKKVLPYDDYTTVLEPSAGTGSFFNLLDGRRMGLDLDPKCAGVQQSNFYDYFILPTVDESVLTIGNPPFGKNSTEAIKFFNHAARFSSAIAFILPKTFRKISVTNRLDKNFNLVLDEDVPPKSFIHLGEECDVPCCMQIWVRSNERRERVTPMRFSDPRILDYFEIVSPDDSDFCFQRVGNGAGTLKDGDGYRDYSPKSNWFIKSHHPSTIEIFRRLDFSDVKNNTAGNPSISPHELVEKFLRMVSSLPKNN
jgi:hypothetical protein